MCSKSCTAASIPNAPFDVVLAHKQISMGMNTSKFLLFVGLGIAFWFNGAMMVRGLSSTVLTEHNPNLVWGFLLTFPLTAVSLVITKSLSGFSYNQLLKPVVIMTFTATLCDGIALTWFRDLYSHSFEIALHGAAFILWAAGLGLAIAYYLDQRTAP
jgi:hypothetical protein